MINKVMVAGTLGADQEVKQLQSGQSVASFSIACNERYKDKQGNQVDKTEWVNIVFWGSRANVIQQYVRKGSKIFVEGVRRKAVLKDGVWQDSLIMGRLKQDGI